jgi:hypothetical protein
MRVNIQCLPTTGAWFFRRLRKNALLASRLLASDLISFLDFG